MRNYYLHIILETPNIIIFKKFNINKIQKKKHHSVRLDLDKVVVQTALSRSLMPLDKNSEYYYI